MNDSNFCFKSIDIYIYDYYHYSVSSAGAALIQQRHIPQTIYGHGMGGGSGPTGLVELCAAAGLDSGGTGPPTSTDAPSQQPQPTVISNPHSHKYSLINQNIVSLQPSMCRFIHYPANPAFI